MSKVRISAFMQRKLTLHLYVFGGMSESNCDFVNVGIFRILVLFSVGGHFYY